MAFANKYKKQGPVWVCAVCGCTENRSCKHKGTDFYALIKETDFKSVEKTMDKAKCRSTMKGVRHDETGFSVVDKENTLHSMQD